MIAKCRYVLKAAVLVVGAAAVLFMAGCGKSSEIETPASGRGGYSVVDATKTRLDFEHKPQRIVSLGLSADEVLLDMVEPDRIAALTYLADDAGISPAADKAVRVKGRVQSGSLESVLAQKPDLVLVPNWTDLNFVELLRGAGVNVYVYKTPTTVKEIKQTICELSNVVDERVAGGKIVAGMEKELAFVRARVGNIAPEEHISVMALSYMGPFGAKGTTFADICNYAEVKNVVAEYDLPPNAAFSEETLIRLNPDLLVIPSWKYDNEQDPSKMREEILSKFGDAFKTFRIWVVPKQSYCCSKIQIARSYPADRKDITCNIIIVLYSVCPQINTLQSFCKIPNPQIISVQIQSVNIMINIRMNERFDFSSTRIIMEKPLIFCTYPECAVMGGTKLPHPFSHFV